MLRVCEDGHEEIVYSSRFCPLCGVLDDRDSALDEIDALKDAIDDLEDTVETLKDEIYRLRMEK